MADDEGAASRLFLTAVVVILMVPGLIVEPGPVSEVVGISAILAIWGLD